MKNGPAVVRIAKAEPSYPSILNDRLQEQAPDFLFALGNIELLQQAKLALFCSVRCPGQKILQAFDFARTVRHSGRTVMGGFHSPMEQECLRVILKGDQPVIICPARGLEKMRLPSDWKGPFAEGRLLLLSRFSAKYHRPTVELARQRNLLVSALADEVCFFYASSGGRLEELQKYIARWDIPILRP